MRGEIDTTDRPILAWATPEAGPPDEVVAAAAAEFKLVVRFCTHREVTDVVRSSRCTIVVIELASDPRPGIELIKRLHEQGPQLTLIAAAADMNVTVLRVALESGATDVLTLPVSEAELQKALIKVSRTGRSGAGRGTGKIVTVYGVRGGLGTTTIAVNLAVQLQTLVSADVALVDLDLQRGDVGAFLNVTPVNSIAAMADATGQIDEIFLAGILTRHASGLFLLPAPALMEEADPLGHGDVQTALGLLQAQFRFTVIDTPRVITGSTLAAFEQSDRILLVTDLSVPGVRAARRVTELLLRLGLPRERAELIVTQSVPGPVPMQDAGRAVGREPFFVIPRDEASASSAMNAGTPLVSSGARDATLLPAIVELAGKVAGLGPNTKAKRGHLLQRIFNREARP